jgi:hypothetical protein
VINIFDMEASKKSRQRVSGLYRVTRRFAVTEQKKALEEFGCSRIYEWEAVDDLLTQLRQGDLVAVPKALCLGPTRKDIGDVVRDIHGKKAAVYVIDTKQHSENRDDAVQMILDAVGQLTGDSKALPSEEAAKHGRKKGAKRRAERLPVEEARVIWKGNPEWSNGECLQHMPGWSEQMAYRHHRLGKRNLAKGRPRINR